jgi:hypothetical protein
MRPAANPEEVAEGQRGRAERERMRDEVRARRGIPGLTPRDTDDTRR